MSIPHWSDCSIHNEDNPGPCDCGASIADRKWWTALYHLVCIRLWALRIRLGIWSARIFCRLSSISNPALCPKNYPRTPGSIGDKGPRK